MKAIKDNGSASQFDHCCAGVANPGGNPSDRHTLRILTLIACLRDGENFSATERPELGTLGLWYSGVQGTDRHTARRAGLTAATSRSDWFSPAHCVGHRA